LPTPKSTTVEDIGRSTPSFPLVGLLIGLILIGIQRLSSLIWPPPAVYVVLVVSLIVVTGGLHLDGLMDTCDGIFSGKERKRILEIMRDSRVGAFGVLSAFCLVLLKTAFLGVAHSRSGCTPLLLFPMLGRWGMVWAIVLFPYARTSPGLGKPFTEFARKSYLAWASFPVIVIAATLLMWQSIPVLIVVGIAAWLMGKWFSRRLSGLTGDNYGAICEITETLSLMVMCIDYGSHASARLHI
jgi:adenosylcobinamide-GDP ribazoletransferase